MKFEPKKAVSIRGQVNHPRPPHIVGREICLANAGEEIYVLDFYKYSEDIFVNGEYLARTGDTWWKVKVGEQIGWIAEKHLGEVSAVLTFL